VLFILYYSICRAQGPLQIVAGSDSIRILETGKIQVFSYVIKNTSARQLTFNLYVNTPSKWQLTPKPITMSLEANSETNYSFNCYIPRGVLADTQYVALTLTPENKKNITTEFSEPVIIKAYTKIQISITDPPEMLNYGETYFYDLDIKNLGNREEKIFVRTFKCVADEAKKIPIEPNEPVTVPLRVTNRTDCRESTPCKEFFSVNIVNEQDSILASLTILYDAVPSPRIRKIDKNVFPIQFLIGNMYDNRSGTYSERYYYAINGNGAIDKNNKHNLAFGYKGPDRYDFSVYGQRQEMFLNYVSQHHNYFIGDKSFNVSTLTEFSRFARGFEAIERYKGTSIGAVYLEPRYMEDIKSEAAFFIDQDVYNNTHIKLIAMRKEEKNMLSDIASAQLTSPFAKDNIVHLEYAIGSSANGITKAAELTLNNRIYKLNFISQNIFADKNFPGFYRNTYFTNTSISYAFTNNFTVGINGFYNEVNFQRDTFLNVVPQNKYITFNISKTFWSRLTTTFSAESRQYKDLMPNPLFYSQDNLVRLRANLNILSSKSSFGNYTELGKTKNYMLSPEQREADFIRTGIDFTQKLFYGSIFSYANYQFNKTPAGSSFSQLYYGGGLNQNIYERLRFSANYNNAFSFDNLSFNRDLISFQGTFSPSRAHEFNFSLYKTLPKYGDQKTQNTILVSYRLTLNVPLDNMKKGCRVYGSIIDSTSNKLKGIPVIIGGRITTTDEHGRFVFNNIPSGSHYLDLDERATGFKKVPTVILPIPITIKEKEKEKYIEIFLVQSVSLNVRVNYTDKRENLPGNLIDKEKPPTNFVVEVSNGDQMLRKTCNVGENLFNGLFPGKWKVKIYENSLPKTVKIEENDQEVEIFPGEEIKVDLYLVRKQRNIIFQDLNQVQPKK